MTDCCPLPLPYLRWEERAGRANVIGEGREGDEGGGRGGVSGSRSGPLGSIRRRSDARSGTRGGVERRSSAATGGGGEAAGEGHARDVVAVQPRLRARVLELDRGPARHEGRVPERAVVRHRQRRDEEREERRRHGDGERGAGHLERRTDPRTRRGRGGESARAEAPTSRAGRRARGGARARAGQLFASLRGQSDRTKATTRRADELEIEQPGRTRPPAAPHICSHQTPGRKRAHVEPSASCATRPGANAAAANVRTRCRASSRPA